MNKDLETVSCNFCGSEEFKIRYVKDGFNIVQCERCDLVFVNPRLSKKAVEALYDEEYFSGKGFDKSIEYRKEFDEKSNRVDLADWDLSAIRELLPLTDADERPPLLDIGSGMGLFLWKAIKRGFDAEGLELSPYACDFTSSLNIKVQNSSVYNAELKTGYYSAIVMKEVIEHLPDPKSALEKVYKSLRKGGVMFLTTGNFDCPERKLKGKDWFYFMPEGHLYIFSHNTMKRYLMEAGFSKVFVTNQGDLLMNFLLRTNMLETDSFKPTNPLKRIVFGIVRGINHFISSGLRVYATK